MIPPGMVTTVLGAKRKGMLTPLQLLCLSGLPLALYHLRGMLASGMGRPHAASRGAIVFVSGLALSLYPAIRAWRLTGAAACVVFASVLGMAFL
jgi:hypothetical protein